jgi:site-specific DNA recombinase
MTTKIKQGDSESSAVQVPAVAYLRCSTDGQVDASIPAQKSAVQKYADEHGYRILRWHADEGIAGWREEREAFQQLIADLDRRHDFRAVLAWDQNRFSRFPPLEACHYWFLLDRAGVHLATCNQGRVEWNSIAGFLTATIKQHADAQHRFQLSADVKRGKRAVAEKGIWQGRVPFAYATDDERHLILGDPAEIELVRRMFREYLAGRSLRSICHQLNDEGLSVLNAGRGWCPTGLRDKLVNPVYAGIFRWNDIEIRDHHPAIIDVATFERVQRLLGERQRLTTPQLDGGGFLFTSLLRCGKCGGVMSGTNRERQYYKCRGAMDRGPGHCDGNTVRQDELLGYVIKALEDDVFTPMFVKRLREALNRKVRQERGNGSPDRVRKELANVETKLAKAKRRLLECDTDLLPVVQEQLRELIAERDRLTIAVEAAQTPVERILADHDERIEEAMQLFSAFGQTFRRADPQHQRQLLRERIGKVEVWTDKVPNGSKVRFVLDRGIVHIRDNNLFTSLG